MKAVLIAVVGLLAISVQAQNTCPTPDYTEDIVPACLSDNRVKLPSYSDPTSYYLCTSGKPVLTKCKSTTPYFSYVYQECTTCADYIPAVECSAIKGVQCQPISGVTTTPASTTTGATTPGGTTVTTPVSSTSTAQPTTVTTPFPGPPVDSTPSGGDGTPAPGAGTTIYVPGPPGPNDPDVPQPPTPPPTVGTIATGPPVLQ